MSGKEFADDLILQGVKLFSDNEGKLNYRGDKNLLSEETLLKLKSFKQEILALLEQHGGEIATFPVSYNQRSRWFSSQLSDGSPAFNIMTVMKIIGKFHIDVLQRAADQLLTRNDILRTTYTLVNGELRQKISESLSLDIDLSYLEQFDSQALNDWIESKSDEKFNLEKGPLVRLALLSVGKPAASAFDDRKEAREYFLMFVVHHIVTDEISYISLILELLSLYLVESGLGSDLHDVARFLPARSKTYLEYIRWENNRLNEERGQLLQNFWKEKLSGPLPVLNLPTDFPRPQTPTYNGSTYHSLIEPNLSKRILEYSNQQKITPYIFFLSVFRILLQRYSGQDDIIVGISISSRYLADCKNVIGDFVNILPLRSRVDEHSAFAEHMTAMKSLFMEAMEHQDYPFSLIVNQIEKSFDASRSPIYQVVFNWQTIRTHGNLIGTIGGDLLADELEIDIVDGASTGVKGTTHDVVLTVKNIGEELACSWTYNTDLFSSESIERLNTHFHTLLDSVLGVHSNSIVKCQHLSKQEYCDLRDINSDTQKVYPQELLIHELFEHQVEENSDRFALHDGNKTISYGALNDEANQLARHLIKQGVSSGTIVAVCADRSIDLMVGLLAVLKAGGCYLAIDPNYPGDRIEYMLEDSEVELVLLTSDVLEDFPLEDRIFFLLDNNARGKYLAEYDAKNISRFERQMSDASLAYVIYTSGTTGNPKGVCLQHAGATNLAFNQRDIFSISKNDRVLQFASISFDAATWEWMMALTNGASLYLLSEKNKLDTRACGSFIETHKISCATIPPAYLNHLSFDKLTSLRVLISAGEVLSEPLARRLLDALPTVTLFNAYGPTEATICATCYRVSQPIVDLHQLALAAEGKHAEGVLRFSDLASEIKVPIGRPLNNCSCFVLDEYLRLLPVGVIGELYIGGAGVARGYLNQPEQGQQKFINNPFSQDSDARLYGTGDLVRLLQDGNLEFIGRSDSQVKIRGFRIELEEIEAELMQDARVREAAVILSNSDTQSAHLLAFVSLDPYASPAAQRIVALSDLSEFSNDKLFQLENGMEVFGLEKSNTEYIYEEIFKRNNYLSFGIEVKEGACVFDVGANIGLFSIYLCNTLKIVQVHAFEPILPIFNVLEKNIHIYGADRVRANAFGLSNVVTEAEFNFYPHNPGISGVNKGHDDVVQIVRRHLANDANIEAIEGVDKLLEERLQFKKEKVSLSTLSAYISENDIQSIDLLKIDVERSEWEVLDGIDEEHWKIIKQIVIEVYDKNGELDRILSILKQRAYQVFIQECEDLKGTNLHHVFAKRLTGKHSNILPIAESPVFSSRYFGPKKIKEQIRDRLKQHLPEYMLPSGIFLMSTLPVNQNGKIDRKALPIEKIEEQLERQYVAPISEMEESLARMWCQVLKIERVGRTDHFFELGGHSLMATQVVSNISKKFRIELPIQDIFASPVLADLAIKVESACQSGRVEENTIGPAPSGEYMPVSFSQERLWLFSKLYPNSRVHNVSLSCRIKGNLNTQAILLALREIVNRHEVLRSRFLEVDNGVVQIVDSESEFSIEIESANSREEVDEIRRAEADVCLDLSRGDLFRGKIIALSDEEFFLVVTMHHCVTDGWSLGILLKELETLYVAFANGKASPLQPLTIQYGDYAFWERRRFSNNFVTDRVRQLDYWQQHLKNLPSLLNLPFDRPRQKIHCDLGSNYEILLPKSFQDKLIQFCKEQNVTLFMLLISTYSILLSRYSGQKDIVVGTPIANRRKTELEPLIGFFVNTLVLRFDLAGNPSFVDFLQQTKKTALDAFANQDIRFEELVELLQPERSLNHAPLVQANFVLQNMPLQNLQFQGLVVEPLIMESTASAYDLTFSFMETDAGLRGSIHFNADLFDAATIREMGDSFYHLLEQFVENQQENISRYHLLSRRERKAFLEASKGAERINLEAALIHELFEEQVLRQPEALALSDKSTQLSYRELNERTNQLAHCLIAEGLSDGEIVAICGERSVELIVGMLAILKAGGAYLAIDSELPEERIQFMLDDAKVGFLLYGNVPFKVSPNAYKLAASLNSSFSSFPASNVKNRFSLRSDSLAYVIYTSGTTGTPKATCLCHGGAVNLALNQRKLFKIEPADRILQFASISFDAATWEWMMALSNGASLHLLPEAAKQNFIQFEKFVSESNINCATLPPAYLSNIDLSRLKSLRILVTAGEKLLPSLAFEVVSVLPNVALYNAYGPTESTVCATVYEVDPKTIGALRNASVPIGKPLDNLACYVLDENEFPLPNNVPGELYIGGVGVARGYLNQPQLTSLRFVKNPFSKKEQDFLYRTGDLVRRLRSGDLEFIGRNDSQVKIRGIRIELGEIENVLMQSPLVAGTAVVAKQRDAAHIYLIAYVRLKDTPDEGISKRETFSVHYRDTATSVSNPTIVDQSVFDHLRRKLPDYMVPNTLVFVDSLPLTHNGKVDYNQLPAVDLENHSRAPYVVPTSDTEKALARIWCEILNQPQIGIFDDFFEKGGHSLLAIRLAAAVSKALLIDIDVKEIFLNPILRDLAREIENARSRPKQLNYTNDILKVPEGSPIPLSYSQERLYFMWRMDSESRAFNISLACRISGPLNVVFLEKSIASIVARHEVLRTRYLEKDNFLLQEISSESSFSLNVETLDKDDDWESWCRRAQYITFDLNSDSLFRIRLLKLSDKEHILLFVIHHSITDGWSLNIIVNELSVLYAAFSKKQYSPLAPLDIQYGDYAYWQRHCLTTEAIKTLGDYWMPKLAGMPALLNIPTDRSRGASYSNQGAIVRLKYSHSLLQGLNNISREQGATLFMVLLAAFNVLLSKYSGQTDIAVGTPVANRRHKDLEPLIGFFVNTVVLRTDLSGDPCFVDLLKQTKNTALDAYSHQDLPFEKLVEMLNVDRNINYPPLVQVSIVLQNMPLQKLILDDLDISPLHVDNDTSVYDLTLSLVESDEGLEGFFQYNTELFDASTIQRWNQNFLKLLEEIVDDPYRSLSALEVISRHERNLLLNEWNSLECDSLNELLIHELFEDVVRKTPNAIALVSQGESLSYQTLNEEANQLARYLLNQGVRPNTIVGILAQRSVNLIVGMLGILKAGACYLALDPSYPKDRIGYICSDANLEIFLVEKSLISELPAEKNKVILIDKHLREQLFSKYSKDNLPVAQFALGPQNLAFVIYTSGTTGKPKGVCLQHQGAANLAISQAEAFSIEARDRIAQFASVGFDAATSEWMMALLNGARLYLVPEAVKSAPHLFEKYLITNEISCLTLPPAYLKQLDYTQFEFLRVLICAGENLEIELARDVKKNLHGLSLFNAYGPCEATVCATIHRVDKSDIDAQIIPIGSPIKHTQCYVLDVNKSLLPIGSIGELYIGGVGVSQGYLNNPVLTNEKFIENPFSNWQGTRLYRTGDLVRRLPNGKLVYVGRYDSQVKLRGIRIELSEIEGVLSAHTGVNDVIVSLNGSRQNEPVIVAYVVAACKLDKDAERQLTRDLKQLVKEKLPMYMSPTAYSFLENIPLTAHGKVDHRALPHIDFGLENEEFVPPSGELEKLLAEIWCDVLQIRRVGRFANFFELGGHSLLAAKVLSRIQSKITQSVEMRDLFKYQTICDIADFISKVTSADAVNEIQIVALTQSSGPVSFGQQRLLIVNEMSEDTAAYHVPLRFILNGKLSLLLFLKAFDYVVNRQSILRTSFDNFSEDGFQQRIHDELNYFVRIVDFSCANTNIDLDNDHPVYTILNEFLLEELSERFQLDLAPLFRLTIFKLSDEKHKIAFTFHHLITDGWSAGLFVSELMDSYEGMKKGNQDPLDPLPIRYLDYSLWQRKYLVGEALEERIRYWKGKLDNIHYRPLIPEDYVVPAARKSLADSIRFTLDTDVSFKLKTICRSKKVTPYMLLLAAFKVILHSFQGEEDIILGTANANRTHVEMEKLVGFFVNTTVIRTNFDNALLFDDILQRVSDFCLESYAFQDCPFEKLVEALAQIREADRNPLFQIMFSMENIALPKFNYGDLHLAGVDIEALHSRFDLELHVQFFDGKVVGEFAYDPQLFKRKTIERLLKGYESLLKRIAETDANFKLRDINFAAMATEKAAPLRLSRK